LEPRGEAIAAVVQQVNKLDDTTAFLETELAEVCQLCFQERCSNVGNIEYGRAPDQNEGWQANQAETLHQEPKNPEGNQRKGGRASPNGVHRALKEPIQLPHRDGKKEDRQVETVCRLQTDQREVSEGCLPNASHKLHPRSTKGSAVHQQIGPEGWVVADPTGKKQALSVPGKWLFQWRVMPFGLHTALATFFRVLDQVIGPEMSPHAFAYQDDLIVIGRTLEKHKINLREVFRRLKEANRRLNPE